MFSQSALSSSNSYRGAKTRRCNPLRGSAGGKRAAPETVADAEEPSQNAAKTETPAAAAVSAALAATLPAAASAPAAAQEPAAAPAAAPADKPADEAEGEEPLPEPKTPEEKEVRGLLVEVGKVEHSHGLLGDKVKITELRVVVEGSDMCEKS